MITFESYSENLFSEHMRRAKNLRAQSRRARLSYALLGLFFGGLPILAIVQVVRFIYVANPIRMEEVLPHTTFVSLMPLATMVGGFFALMGLIFGFAFGVYRARNAKLEAENFDIKVRQEYHLLCISKFLEGGLTRTEVDEPTTSPKKAGAVHHQIDDDVDPLFHVAIATDARDDHETSL